MVVTILIENISLIVCENCFALFLTRLHSLTAYVVIPKAAINVK